MKTQLLVTTLCALVSIPSFAAQFYVLGDLGRSELEVKVEEDTYFSKKDNTFSIGMGYKLNDNVALEFAYRDIAEVNNRDSEYQSDELYFNESTTTSLDAFNISVVGTLPVGEAASIYGRLGVGKIKYKESYRYEEQVFEDYYSYSDSISESKNKILAGIGFQYAVNESVALRAEYSRYQKWEDLTIYSTTIGLTYQF